MIEISEIKKKTEEYAKKHFGSEQILFDPIFRKESNKYYLGFLVIELVDEANKDFRIKRPTKWILVDILTGDLVDIFDAHKYDYSSRDSFPYELIFDNSGNTSLYDYSNYILQSYRDWETKLMLDLEKKVTESNTENQSADSILAQKVLRFHENNVTQKEYIMANIKPTLDEIYEILAGKIGSNMQKAHLDYYEYLIDSIRREYADNNVIDKLSLTNYVNLLKYLWPDCVDIIKQFDNVS